MCVINRAQMCVSNRAHVCVSNRAQMCVSNRAQMCIECQSVRWFVCNRELRCVSVIECSELCTVTEPCVCQ